MPLTPGSRLGPYEILSALGAGGMGEVYKAKDTRLDRLVAIKVLPSHLSERPELRQRFDREARAISSLSHPHICTLHDVGHQDGVDFLVMEHLEGESLAERLAKGPLPPDQVLRCGIEIAEALDRAHRQGIVHRDLKPGNVMLTKSGVKLLDFGLAKIAAGPGAASNLDALTSLPTEVAGGQPLTTEGTLLGTFQYMAPEQLEGHEADARTDLFAFGELLYEMATGRPAFQGKSRASLISSIMSSEPPAIASLQPLTPPALDRVIRTCLAKDPEERWQTAHDVALQLRWIQEGGSQLGVPAPVAARRRGRERLAWLVAGVAGVVAVALALVMLLRPHEPRMTRRFGVPAAHGMTAVDSPRISPDGGTIAVNATDSTGTSMIWVRPLGSMDYQPLSGTEGAHRPFWSPDSRYIGFFAQGKLKKIPVTGGPAQIVCDGLSGSDGTWGKEGVILFDGSASDPIRRVSASGGVPVPEVASDSGAVGWPHFLPDGKHYIYMTGATGAGDLMVGELGSKKRTHLGIHGSRAEYSAAGYLLYVKDRTLLAQRFDPGSLRLGGEPLPVAEPVGTGQGGSLGHFSVSRNGVLIYSQGGSASNRLVWVDRTGKVIGQAGPPADMLTPALSPDGTRVAARISDPQTGNRDIWLLDLARGTSTRFTFNAAADNLPLWTPDGRDIIFCSNRNGAFDLFRKPSDGSADEESLYVDKADKFPSDVSRDGKYVIFMSANAQGNQDLRVVPLSGERKAVTFVGTSFDEVLGRFSPDGRWIAYNSNASGKDEVYVQPFPGPGGKWQISTAGGSEPTWRGDGRELYYLTPDTKLMSVDVKTNGNSFEAGVPAPLFTMLATTEGWTRYEPTQDGRRFLVVTPERSQAVLLTTVILDWDADVGKK